MERSRLTLCRRCSASLGKQNTSGYCHPCAMREAGRRRREENTQFAKLVQACREACPEAVGRLRYFLNEQQQLLDLQLARLMGPRLSADLKPSLPSEALAHLWWREQNRAGLPDAAFEVQKGRTYLFYWSRFDQDGSQENIRHHFEAAVRREYPELMIAWSDVSAGSEGL